MLETSNSVQKSILSTLDGGVKGSKLATDRQDSPSFDQTLSELRQNSTEKNSIEKTSSTTDESSVAKNEANGKSLPPLENASKEKPPIENSDKSNVETKANVKKVADQENLLNRVIATEVQSTDKKFADAKLITPVNELSKQVAQALSANDENPSLKSSKNILTLNNKDINSTVNDKKLIHNDKAPIVDSNLLQTKLIEEDVQTNKISVTEKEIKAQTIASLPDNANIVSANLTKNEQPEPNIEEVNIKASPSPSQNIDFQTLTTKDIEDKQNEVSQKLIEDKQNELTQELAEEKQNESSQNPHSPRVEPVDITTVTEQDKSVNEKLVNTSKNESEVLMVNLTEPLTEPNKSQPKEENIEELSIEESIDPSLANFLSQLHYVPKVSAKVKEQASQTDEKLITQDNVMSKSSFVDVTASRTKAESNIIGNESPDNVAKPLQQAQIPVIDQLNRPGSAKEFKQTLEQSKTAELKIDTAAKPAEVELSNAIKASEGVKNTVASDNQSINNPTRLLTDFTIKSPIQTKQWNRDFNHHVSMVAKNGGGIAKIKLNPEHLGPIEASVKIMHETASVQIVAHHSLTRDAIEQNIQRLREQLEQQGFTQVDVNVSDRKTSEQNEKSHQQGNHLSQGEMTTEDEEIEQAMGSVNQQTDGLLDTYV